MKLNKNSWHVHLNDFVWGHGYSKMQNNLCPYFWGTIAAVFLAIPTMIYNTANDIIGNKVEIDLILRILGSILVILGIIIISNIGNIDADEQWTNILGGTYFIGFGTFLLLITTTWLQNWYDNMLNKPSKPKEQKEHRPHMSVEMVKGWKNKHCPMIVWEDKNGE